MGNCNRRESELELTLGVVTVVVMVETAVVMVVVMVVVLLVAWYKADLPLWREYECGSRLVYAILESLLHHECRFPSSLSDLGVDRVFVCGFGSASVGVEACWSDIYCCVVYRRVDWFSVEV